MRKHGWFRPHVRGLTAISSTTLREGGGVSIPPHARWVATGDSISSQSSSKGLQNWVMLTNYLLGGRLRPSVAADQAIGGQTMGDVLARLNYVTAQAPQVVFEMSGHNDGFTAGSTVTRVTAKRAILDALRAALPAAVIVAHAALPSSAGNEDASVLSAFNADIQAWVGADRRSIYIPVPAGWAHATHTYDGTHPNIAGALLIARNAVSVLSGYIASANVLDEVTAAGEFGANLDAEHALPGTAGTKTGTTTPTGSVATGKEVTNNTSAAVACSKGTRGSDASQIIDVTGSPAATGLVVFDESSGSSVTISPTIGQYYEYVVGVAITKTDGVSASTGVRDLSAGVSTLGDIGYNASNANNTTELAEAVDGVLRTIPHVILSTNTVVPSVATRHPIGVAADARIEIYKPIVRRIELTAYALPFYTGGDGIQATADTVRITGTASSGQVLTGGPGKWSGGNLVMSYQWKRYNAGTNAFAEDIAGATASTYTLTAGDVGFKIGLRVTAANSFGAVPQDSALSATVA